MNFWRYTFRGSFLYYAAIACIVAIVVMLMFYITANTRGAFITFCVLTTLLKVGITGSYVRWRKYRNMQRRFDEYYKIEKRFNLIVLLVLFLSACGSSSDSIEQPSKPQEYPQGYFEWDGGGWYSTEYRIEQKTIDGCEYILIFGSQGRNIIHKANCKNSFHACK